MLMLESGQISNPRHARLPATVIAMLLKQAFCTAVMSSIGGASADDTAAFLKIASGTLAFIETMSSPTNTPDKDKSDLLTCAMSQDLSGTPVAVQQVYSCIQQSRGP